MNHASKGQPLKTIARKADWFCLQRFTCFDDDADSFLKFLEVLFDFFLTLIYLDYSRVEVAAGAKRRVMKLWSSTANGPQQSRRRCEVG